MTYPILPGWLSCAIQKVVKVHETSSSSAYFRVGRTCLLFLFSSRSHHHEESTSKLWTFVPRKSILHHSHSFKPARPTAPRWLKLDVKFCLWHQHFNSYSDISNSTLVWLSQLYSCSDIQLLYSFSTITTVVFFLRLTAQRFLHSGCH